MGFIIGLLTFFMVLDCVVLVFLVLIQLPKKEAGAGLAFGGAASDALFGAGSGNVLTKITKYAATIFFAMAIFLSVLQSHVYGRSTVFQQKLVQPGHAAGPMGSVPVAPAKPAGALPLPLSSVPASNNLTSVPQAEATNPPASATNPAPPK
ncbi:MAG TPA: preprotein translocase subunit SecG [Verrucomicrobiae bacterium]|nr:preprotein translocase subunit SecG [Verrucomicrobiae bacterium]